MSNGVLHNAGRPEVQPLDVCKLQNLVKRSIRRTNNSAAGPDGAPYAAYKETLDISPWVLADTLDHMFYGGTLRTMDGLPSVPEQFTYATIVCLLSKNSRGSSSVR